MKRLGDGPLQDVLKALNDPRADAILDGLRKGKTTAEVEAEIERINRESRRAA